MCPLVGGRPGLTTGSAGKAGGTVLCWRRGHWLALKALERAAKQPEHLVPFHSLTQEEGKGRAETSRASAYNSGWLETLGRWLLG